METLTRARKAIESGAFAAEIAPISVPAKGGDRVVANDEHPLKVSPEKIPACKPAFRADGTITAASASANADGAAALILTRRSRAEREGLPILAEIKAHATHSPGARLVHDRADPGDPQAARQGRLDGRRRRPVRDQRGVRGRRHGGRSAISASRATGSTSTAAPCALGHPDRRHRRAPDRHAAARSGQSRRGPRRRRPLHRRRRSHRDRHRARALRVAKRTAKMASIPRRVSASGKPMETPSAVLGCPLSVAIGGHDANSGRHLRVRQWAKNTGSSAAARMWLVAPPKIICRSRLCV